MTLPILGLLIFAALGILLALQFEVVPVVVMVAVAGLILTEFVTGHGSSEVITGIWAMLDRLFMIDVIGMLFLFIFLGNLAFYAGISTRIYHAAAIWLRGVPGGLAVAAILGCGGFAAMSGSSVACATTMGRICVPEMLREGYDPRLASSSVAVGGTLGALIPPSLLFIFYGLLADQPVAHLFIAGLLPGLLSLLGMVLSILWWVMESPRIAPASRHDGAGREAGLRAIRALWPVFLLFVIMIGGLLSGILTPVLAAGTSVGLVLVTGVIQGQLSPGNLWMALRESVGQSLVALTLVVAARLLMEVAGLTGLDQAVIGWAGDLELSSLVIMAICAITYLILGMFIGPLGILALTLPVMLPLAQAYGMNLIWFGVVLVKLLEIALITPPVGLNVFIINSVSQIAGLGGVFRGVARFLMVDLLVLVTLILFPTLSTLLPASMP